MKQQESSSLRFLYNTTFGRLLLKPITGRTVSKLCGTFLDSPISKCLIDGFVKSNNIDLSQCQKTEFDSFNDFFTRKLKDGSRPIDTESSHLISPCDGLLTVYKINGDTVMPVKQSRYSIASLLHNKKLAREFDGGYAFVFRLCVNHYHRYCYPDSGSKGENYFIKGKLHTVRPIALEAFPVFCENCREYTVIESDNFGRLIQMEVGALLVGKIANRHGSASFVRGEEKGKFLYGGSTVILLVKKDTVNVNGEIMRNSLSGIETPVKMGESIATKLI